MTDLVTIITPSLNQGRFIERTIRSVLEQDYPRIEHLVYDAGSTDQTHAVLERYRDRIRTLIAPDKGQADAINRGFREGNGEIVAWLNSDDLYLPGAVSKAVAYLAAHPRCTMVYGEAQYIDADGKITGRYPTAPASQLVSGCYICQPATFMRRHAVAAVGYLDPALEFCMDYDLWLRLAARFQIGYLPDVLACSRLHAQAKTVAKDLAFHREVVLTTYKRLGAAPFRWIYGYAMRLARERLGGRGGRVFQFGTTAALTAGLCLRYHWRPARRL